MAGCLTHVVPPRNFVGLGVSLDVTFKVDVVSLLQVSGVDSRPQVELNTRRNWNYISIMRSGHHWEGKLHIRWWPGIKMTD